MDKNEIIHRISYIRNRAELSQKALSIAIGYNIGYINRLESKKDFLPSLEILLKIIKECGSSTEEFFYYSIPAFEEDKQLLDIFKNIKGDKKKSMIDLLK